MGRHAEWEVVNKKDGIVMIRDLERSGCLSITNDAEYVYDSINSFRRGQPLRVVYQGQNDGNEWWEIVVTAGNYAGNWRIYFRPWHGEVWDKLTRV